MGNKISQEDQEHIEMFWTSQRAEIENINNFKIHPFPLTRIKNMMKANSDDYKISAEVHVIVAKACELFIRDVTFRSWLTTLKKNESRILRETINDTLNQAYNMDFVHNLTYFNKLMSSKPH